MGQGSRKFREFLKKSEFGGLRARPTRFGVELQMTQPCVGGVHPEGIHPEGLSAPQKMLLGGRKRKYMKGF